MGNKNCQILQTFAGRVYGVEGDALGPAEPTANVWTKLRCRPEVISESCQSCRFRGLGEPRAGGCSVPVPGQELVCSQQRRG